MNFRTSPSKEEDIDPLQTFSCKDHWEVSRLSHIGVALLSPISGGV